jgi:alkylation response protein AidB-like acyl-CoA dehydrogenase
VAAARIEILRLRHGQAPEEGQNGGKACRTEAHAASLDDGDDPGTWVLVENKTMPFFQEGPTLGNQFTEDGVLRSYLDRTLPPDVRAAVEPELAELGELSGGKLHEQSVRERKTEPVLTQWDAWGKRVDTIELVPLWKEMAKITAEHGLVATAYEKKHGESSRVLMFAKNYVVDPSSGVYSCPLAMTDGAAKTLLLAGNKVLVDRALPQLLSRDPKTAWTSGQWMTERTGGSDVAISETVARPEPGTDRYRLHGTKWFSSATTSEMALTLARPEGNPPSGHGLALFYVETRDSSGALNGILVNRLKDKLGTRMVPTAELTLDGALATPVAGLTDGIKNITPMLSITRTWNAIGAVSGMRRAIALARDYAKKRVAFGAPLSKKPLHVDTLAGLEAEFEGGFHLAFRAVELLGKEECGTASEEDQKLLRYLTPILKLLTARQAVAVASEALEAFGGAGYVEDTGLPRILRDAQVLSIWEGTTNVLSLDVLRVLGREGTLEPIVREVFTRVERGNDPVGQVALQAIDHAGAWLQAARAKGVPALEEGARRLAMTLGRAIELALLVDHAAWEKAHGKGGRTLFAARRFARHGVDLIVDETDAAESSALANDA